MENNQLPFSMAVAAKATELDNIKVIVVNEPIDTHWAVGIYPDEVENYEAVLIEKLASIINENIKEALEKNPDAKLYVYILGQIVKDGNLMIAISKCEIK
jgi:hypothetical protein